MALTDLTTIQTVTDALGAADNNLQATLVLSGTTAAQKLADARGTVHDDATEADFDDNQTFVGAMRTIEKSMPTIVKGQLNNVAKGMDTYFIAQTGSKFRVYAESLGVTWADTFRTLWRRSMAEEIIVPLGHIIKSGGAWPGSLTADKALGTLDVAMALRTGITAAIGAAAITVNITLTRSTGTSDLVVVTIPANTPANSVIALTGGTSKWVSVFSIAVTGGTNADRIEVWVAE